MWQFAACNRVVTDINKFPPREEGCYPKCDLFYSQKRTSASCELSSNARTQTYTQRWSGGECVRDNIHMSSENTHTHTHTHTHSVRALSSSLCTALQLRRLSERWH